MRYARNYSDIRRIARMLFSPPLLLQEDICRNARTLVNPLNSRNPRHVPFPRGSLGSRIFYLRGP